MPSWSHSKPEVRSALDEAAMAEMKVEPTETRGHSWGYLDCVHPDCSDPRRRYYVNSTPKNQHDEASKIPRFVRRHQHRKETGQP